MIRLADLEPSIEDTTEAQAAEHETGVSGEH